MTFLKSGQVSEINVKCCCKRQNRFLILLLDLNGWCKIRVVKAGGLLVFFNTEVVPSRSMTVHCNFNPRAVTRL